MEPTQTPPTAPGDRAETSHRIRIRIPQEQCSEPVISQLISRFGLTINIAAALLGKDGRGDGWFDLELRGTRDRIDAALEYLQGLTVEVWHEGDADHV